MGTYPGAGTRFGPVKVPVNGCSWKVPVVETCSRGNAFRCHGCLLFLKKTDGNGLSNLRWSSWSTVMNPLCRHSLGSHGCFHKVFADNWQVRQKTTYLWNALPLWEMSQLFYWPFPQHEAWLDTTVLGVNTLERASHWLIKIQHAACVFDCTLCPH